MGFRIARKHAAQAAPHRAILGFAPARPAVLVGALAWPAGRDCALLAAPLRMVGMLVERWLFFAEAKHTVTLYYGQTAV